MSNAIRIIATLCAITVANAADAGTERRGDSPARHDMTVEKARPARARASEAAQSWPDAIDGMRWDGLDPRLLDPTMDRPRKQRAPHPMPPEIDPRGVGRGPRG